MILNSSHKIFFSVSLLSLLAIVIIGFVIVPAVVNIKQTTNETYKLRVGVEKKYNDSLKSRLTKKKIEDIKQNSIDFSTYLFKSTHGLKLIQLLETMASNNQVNQKINLTTLDNIKAQGQVKINLTISGDFQDILNYIHELEASDYFLNIENIRLTPDQNKSDWVNLNLNISLYVSE
ncbi:MAG: hypothetical protein ABIH87_00555 [bacterium]